MRYTIPALALFAGLWVALTFFDQRVPGAIDKRGTPMQEKIVKTEAEWRALLTPEQFRVTRQKGTEQAFCGAFWEGKEPGTYCCVCCGQPLFTSGTQYHSGTGWPSFFQPVNESAIELHNDSSWFMNRTEVVCSRCDAHLGHVFKDGPKPTGLRYCMNSASLKLVPEGGEAAK